MAADDDSGSGERDAPVTGDSPPTRRAVLGALGTAAVAGLAGCSAGTDAEPTATDEGSANATGDGTGATRNRSPDAPESPTATGEESVYTRVYRRTVGSVVQVLVPNGGLGSGFVYDGRYAVTNYHVVAGYDRVQVQFSRGESATGTVVGTDRYTDLAVVRVRDRPSYAEPLSLATQEPVIGTRVAAIGSPYGLEGSLTTGVVSGVNRSVPSPNAEFNIPNAVQTDAPVNPGNSGGPLVNLDGEVLGVINSGGGNDIAFAISAPLVRRVVPSLVEDGEYRHPFVGVELVDVTEAVARANGMDRARGLLVRSVVEGGPADGVLRPSTRTERVSGFRVPVGGDVVLSVNGREVSSRRELLAYLELNASPGDTVTLRVLRGGEVRTVELTLGARREFQ